MDWAQNRKALRLIHFSAFARVPRGGALPAFPRQGNAAPAVLRAGRRTGRGRYLAARAENARNLKRERGGKFAAPLPFCIL